LSQRWLASERYGLDFTGDDVQSHLHAVPPRSLWVALTRSTGAHSRTDAALVQAGEGDAGRGRRRPAFRSVALDEDAAEQRPCRDEFDKRRGAASKHDRATVDVYVLVVDARRDRDGCLRGRGAG
jgi:hypothetical protein